MISDAAAVKRHRVTAVGIEDAPDDANHQKPSGGLSHNVTVSNSPLKHKFFVFASHQLING